MLKLILVLLLLWSFPASAQQSAPLSMDFTAQPDGVVNSKDQQNILPSGSVSLFCIFNMTNKAGNGPGVVYKIQGKGAGQYYDMLVSSPITVINTPALLIMGSGVTSIANQSVGLPVPPGWRIVVTVTKVTSGVTIDGALRCKVQ